MIKDKGSASNPAAGSSGVGGNYTTGINTYPGGDIEVVDTMQGLYSPTKAATEAVAKAATEAG